MKKRQNNLPGLNVHQWEEYQIDEASFQTKRIKKNIIKEV